MTAIILILTALNIVAGEFSVTGQRLRMSSHPVFVRIRFLGFGMVAALFLVGHNFLSNDWLTWLAVLLLSVGVARFPQKRRDLNLGTTPDNVTTANGPSTSRLGGG